MDQPESATYDRQEDSLFVSELKKRMKPEIEICTVEANMEEPSFSKTVFEACEEVFQ